MWEKREIGSIEVAEWLKKVRKNTCREEYQNVESFRKRVEGRKGEKEKKEKEKTNGIVKHPHLSLELQVPNLPFSDTIQIVSFVR